jgi:hypothetical protein
VAFDRFNVGYGARVSAEFGLDKWDSAYVTVRTEGNNTWQLQMTADRARDLSRQLKRAADLIDPPKKRVVKV